MDNELEDAIKLTVQGCDASLYDIVTTKEHKKNILRVYITSKDGVSLEKCTQISRMLSPVLDIHEPFKGEYNLEVSSPGIERKLKSLHHFQCSIGENVKLKELSMEVFKGKLESVDENGQIVLKTEDGNEHKTSYENILSASTYFQW